MCYILAGGDGAGSSSAESVLPWVLIEDGTNKQLSAEERSVSHRIPMVVPATVCTLMGYYSI